MKNQSFRTFGLIGHPLGHSFSQRFFTEKFANEGIDAQYLNFDIDSIDKLRDVLADNQSLVGLNVTIPYKQVVMPLLHEIDADAAAIGAVNVIKISHTDSGELHLKGYNSDIIGFTDSLRRVIGNRKVSRALVLGTGGASRAIVAGLHKMGIETQLVSRTPGDGVITYADLTETVMQAHQVVVNTTPLGTFPNVDAAADIPYHLLTPNHVCFDLVYNPNVTKFMALSAEHGATVSNGLEMLHGQAIAAWKIWNI
jgi:shikimate dehydrogenase